MFATLLVSQGLHFGPVSAQQPFRKGFKTLMSNRRWLLFLTMVFIAGTGMATVTTYLFPFMEQVGASRGLMGLSQTIATLAELPFLFFANRLIDRFHARGLLLLSMAVVGVRLLLYWAFPTPTAILIIQLLHGLTFATIWVAGVSYAHENAPAGVEATAQGIFGSTMMGVGAAAGNFFGALLMEAVGGRQMYLFMGLMVLVSLGLFLLIEKRISTASQGTVPSSEVVSPVTATIPQDSQ
jgi:PPP family 3-phenylpropionic acid transporter